MQQHAPGDAGEARSLTRRLVSGAPKPNLFHAPGLDQLGDAGYVALCSSTSCESLTLNTAAKWCDLESEKLYGWRLSLGFFDLRDC